MGRLKAEGLVKPVRVGAALVRGELDQAAAAIAALSDRPLQHHPADAAAAFPGGDTHALYLAAPHAASGQAGDEAELQDADYLAAAFGNREKLVRVTIDRGKGIAVAGI